MKAVIFDFDGTIVDSLAGVIRVYEKVIGGNRVLTAEQRRNLQNKNLLQIALAMGVPKWKLPFLALWGRRMFRHHMRSVQVHPGMTELIQTLHSRGVKLYVLSANRTANVEKYLGWHGLTKYFVGVYGGASFFSKVRKMRQLLDTESLAPKDVWCVGDEKIDVRSAHAVGMKVLAVSWGYSNKETLLEHQPEALVTEAHEILQHLPTGGS
ncbi:MAG: HAD hydrolase-like protein [Candidatus Saccharimonadales bacterium]